MKEGKVWDNLHTEFPRIEVHKDKYPVTEGHLLFIPKEYDGSNQEDISECFSLALFEGRRKVSSGEWDGFNIGLNWGEAAGQTVAWPHVHLIPRRKGDMEDPKGGVRGVIPEKQKY